LPHGVSNNTKAQTSAQIKITVHKYVNGMRKK